MIQRRAFVLGAGSSLLKGGEMERFAMYGKVVAKAGQRDAMVGYLLEAARLLTPLEGCQLYIVNTVPSEPDTIWVTELWRSEADHDASLKMESVMAVIAKAKPLVASFEGVRLVPVGGKGLTTVSGASGARS